MSDLKPRKTGVPSVDFRLTERVLALVLLFMAFIVGVTYTITGELHVEGLILAWGVCMTLLIRALRRWKG